MKIYRNVMLSAKSLRTGLFAVCFFAVMCAAAGCGKTDDLLSELRGENTTDEAQGSGTVQNTAPDVDGEIQKIYVHVCGAVKSPGVYELSAGSRFYEAVEAAGGFAEEACEDYLNMAAILADGSRLEIPTQEEIREREAAGEKWQGLSSESDADASGGLVNINTADADGLCRLPGIGEGRAKAIIEYRQKQGGFQKKEDIMQVSGIGEKMYARMEEYLTVE